MPEVRITVNIRGNATEFRGMIGSHLRTKVRNLVNDKDIRYGRR